jgi:putative phosphoribosyl transferase
MSTGTAAIRESAVTIPVGNLVLHADLVVPAAAIGIELFAHGSGSSRNSPRNRAVAAALHHAHFATLLLDLLTLEEERIDSTTAEFRFDIPLLARRLAAATLWVRENPQLGALPIGYFGASTGAAAALVAAAQLKGVVSAVVSRGGRPDLAGTALAEVRAPTLLIVGGYDQPVIDMNREARTRMRATTAFEIVPRATHLFEEPGAMEQVTQLARVWFEQHLARQAVTPGTRSGW